MTRLALLATPTLEMHAPPAPGALDGDLVRSRLALDDARFRVIDLDPGVDLAEQTDRILEREQLGPADEVLFYASGAAALSDQGEFFLCLDRASPETGDALGDLAAVFRDRAPGPVLFVLECRHAPDAADPFRSATLVAAAKASVRGVGAGFALLMGARPTNDRTEEVPSPFTRAMVETLDDVDPALGITAEALYGRVCDSEVLLGVVPGFGFVQGTRPFVLVPMKEGARRARQASTLVPPSAGVDMPVVIPQTVVIAQNVAAAPVHAESVNLPKVIVTEPAAVASPALPVVAARSTPPAAPTATPSGAGGARAAMTVAEHLASAEAHVARGEHDEALAELKLALASGSATPLERAGIYVCMGDAKRAQGKGREAVSNYEKALSIVPAHRGALEAVIELYLAEHDFRAVVAAEDRLLAIEKDSAAVFSSLLAFAKRSEDVAGDLPRARLRLEAARDLRPDDVSVLDALQRVYSATGAHDLALGMRRRAAQATSDPKARAARFFALGKHLLRDLEREDEGLATLELALETDPSALQPLEIIAQVLAERQEWSELEKAYRRMLGRTERMPKGAVRAEVIWELCRRLGLLLRDHLDDPELALDAFADSLAEKPDDLGGHLGAAELARETGQLERALGHWQVAAALDPSRLATFHALFELCQRTGRPDQAYCAASVTAHLCAPEPRERAVFDAHRPTGLPKVEHPLLESSWDLFTASDRDRNVAAILGAIAAPAIAFRVARTEAEGRMPVLDPATRQDPHLSTLSIVRSFVWASHLLGVEAPPLYLREGTPLTLAAVATEPPVVVAGDGVLRGRSLSELAFLAGRQLAYFVGSHRLLLYYPSLDDLSACFLAAIGVAKAAAPVPGALRAEVEALQHHLESTLADHQRDRLQDAVSELEQAGGRVDLSRWAGSVERCATRAGYTLSGDLDIVAGVLRSEPRSVLSAEAKLDDLVGFAVSDAYHELRVQLGVAIADTGAGPSLSSSPYGSTAPPPPRPRTRLDDSH